MKARAHFLWLLFPLLLVPDKPDWVKNFGVSARYPKMMYLVGMGTSSDKDPADARQNARSSALASISQQIRVAVSSRTSTVLEEGKQGFAEMASSVTSTSTAINLEGVSYEEYYNDGDHRQYTLAYVRRDRLSEIYHDKVATLREKLSAMMRRGGELESAGKKTEAVTEYSACYTVLPLLQEAHSILLVTDDALSDTARDPVTPENIGTAIRRVAERPVLSVDDAAWFLVFTLSKQHQARETTKITAPTFKDTRMSSSLGRYLQQKLEQEFTSLTAAQLVGASEQSRYIVTGTYWPRAGTVEVILQIRRTSTGEITGSAQTELPGEAVRAASLDLTPENFAQSMEDQKVFSKDELVATGLRVEVWTDRGSDGVVYVKDDTMRIFIRANHECNIRLVYYMADGRRNLLLDSYHVPAEQVNKVIPINDALQMNFICSEPFGAEHLQVFARTTDFEPVTVNETDGMRIIKEEVGTFVATMRGMKAVKDTSVQQAEARIVVTTLKQ